jgi:hypothetical protein
MIFINYNGALPQTPVHSFARPKERNQEKAAPVIIFKRAVPGLPAKLK